VKHAGADRVLFGTDSPIMDGRHHIAKVATADISEEDKIKILGLNAIELLGLDES
jgi:predicted TIM-barrel fold metal-dependent hydrolase